MRAVEAVAAAASESAARARAEAAALRVELAELRAAFRRLEGRCLEEVRESNTHAAIASRPFP